MRPSAWFAALFVLLAANAESATRTPVAVSPGSASGVALVEARCPTFSWGQVERARAYDLVVYRIGEDGEVARPALRQNLPGSLGSWTPALDRCLDRGQRYGWAVRAHSARAESPWSETLLFEIASRPAALQVDEALAVLREYLATPAARAPEGAAAVARPITTREEEGAPAGSMAVEPRAVATTTGLQLGLGAYQGGTSDPGSVVAGHKKQMIIAGEYNTGPNVGSSVKLLISDYDNEASDIYPIYVEDENNLVDFYVRKQAGKVSSAYFGGSVGIGTTQPAATLHVDDESDAEPGHGGILVLGPIDGSNLVLDRNEIMARDAGDTSTLYLNYDGGDVEVGGSLDIGYVVLHSEYATRTAQIECPAGLNVLGGGCSPNAAPYYEVDIHLSVPLPHPKAGWSCHVEGTETVRAFAICARLKGQSWGVH
jgi:hypothetical protein